jgi:hypothetical protein
LAVGDFVDAARLLALSDRIKQMLMPSERDDLENKFAVMRGREKPGPKTFSN